MPSFRPPCWPSKSLSHFDEQERARVVPAKETANSTEGSILAKPTSTEYAEEAAKEFLDALEAVADQIPVPGVATAVKIAKGIIQACDESHATLDRAEELKLRIKKLVTILVDELKEKKVDDIQEKLQQDIKSLSNDLEYIQGKLNDIASQNALLLIVFRGLNEEKVKKCVGRLDNSLANFNLVRQINDVKFLKTLEKQILVFHSRHQQSLDDMHGKVDRIQATMDNVKAILEERNDLPTNSRPRLRAAIPANAGVFHGRDPLVAQLVSILTAISDDQKRPRVCLLGPGGMGKTSTALAVMAHPDMKNHFPEQNQIWVPCVKATSVSLFLDTLYSSLGTAQNTGDTLREIISEIKASAKPLMILLDNFETLWNLVESRSETEQILYELDQIAHVTLFITMRSSIPPCNGKQWHSFDIEAVDETAARQIYLDVCSVGSDDVKLPVLLQTLGHMPLAITLMANMARMTGLGAEMLMEEYERIGTAMLGQGGDARHSLEVCISLSVDSQPMKKHPEAYELLATLAMLPVGTTYKALVKWWAPDSPNLMGVLQVLAETALIQRRGMNYSVLPVIRSYILDSSRFPSNVRAAMITSACNFLTQHKSSPGDSTFKEHAEALAAEEGNLQTILLGVADPEPRLVDALLVLAQHQLSTRPRLEVIEHALKLARQMEGHEITVGDTLICYGWILLNLDRYDDAERQFSFAGQTFLSIPDEQRAARSLLDLVYLYCAMGNIELEKKLPLVKDATSIFEKLDDRSGIALSLYHHGFILGQNDGQGQEKSIELLTRAWEMFHDLGDALNHAKCAFFLAQVYYWERQYDAALVAGKIAAKEYEDLGQYSGDPMIVLGQTLFMKGDYPEALETLVRTLAICQSYGRPWDIAMPLEFLGRTWATMDQKEDAHGAYMEAIRYYSLVQGQIGEDGITRCRIFIRHLENLSFVPTSEEICLLQVFHRDYCNNDDNPCV